MARAELIRRPRAGALALGLVALAVQAQTQPPAGSPADVAYTATTAGDASLYPRAPGLDAQPGVVFRGEQAGIDYALPAKSAVCWWKSTATPCQPTARRR